MMSALNGLENGPRRVLKVLILMSFLSAWTIGFSVLRQSAILIWVFVFLFTGVAASISLLGALYSSNVRASQQYMATFALLCFIGIGFWVTGTSLANMAELGPLKEQQDNGEFRGQGATNDFRLAPLQKAASQRL